ncbi:Dolichyl-phosphate-mannose-protein mannosyltransferase 4 [Zancudomyces culisetae]|uniref:Dolichyl-phosphate-mannose--protein mannosyltransferase n=1 Tax=Zancudomyces culisetae TaxID=1213189 RepID=A0A1R1PDU2_ZANCU|nr:Dolichyl-phosphate-mannose-protein mannosyltransferase 4 [Zancudomyces culisetae]|eukprot:OMH79042.1 Dolichyl-phosphate-mannose-protein mannosyltransferase 4 [Zancudomyces culisetae]
MRTHDVASPLTTTNMEFTTVEENDQKVYPDTIFILRINNARDSEDMRSQLRTLNKHIRLTSKKFGVSAYTFNKNLPDWGFYDQEINGKKDSEGEGTLWTVNNVFGRKVEENANEKAQPPSMCFISKFLELRSTVSDYIDKQSKSKKDQSYPGAWPLYKSGISYWTKAEGLKQIHFVANIFGWYSIVAAVLAFNCVYLVAAFFKYRRNTPIVNDVTERHLFRSGLFMQVLYLFHYVPFFFLTRAVYIHEYLPSVVFGYMLLGAVIQFAIVQDYTRFVLLDPFNVKSDTQIIPNGSKAKVFVAAVAVLQFLCFAYWSPFVYGCAMTKDSISAKEWNSNWHFSFTK